MLANRVISPRQWRLQHPGEPRRAGQRHHTAHASLACQLRSKGGRCRQFNTYSAVGTGPCLPSVAQHERGSDAFLALLLFRLAKRVLRKYSLGMVPPPNFQPSDMRDLADDPEHLFTRAEVWRITLLVVGAVLALIGAGAAEGLLMR